MKSHIYGTRILFHQYFLDYTRILGLINSKYFWKGKVHPLNNSRAQVWSKQKNLFMIHAKFFVNIIRVFLNILLTSFFCLNPESKKWVMNFYSFFLELISLLLYYVRVIRPLDFQINVPTQINVPPQVNVPLEYLEEKCK